MTSTTLEPSQVAANRLAHGYRWEDERWKDEPLLSNGSFGSMGGMLTSVRDLSRYVGVFLSAWPPRDGPETAPIRRSSLREMQHLWSPAPASVTRDRAGAVQLNLGGYGYGLRISQTCSFKTIVSHGGGLPGFGSTMTWLPDYGIGVVAFGNLTYTGWGGIAINALEVLTKKGGLQPRQPAPSPALTDARDKVSRLVCQLGRSPRRQHRRRELVPRSDQGAPSRGDRAPARARSAPARPAAASTTSRTRCAARGR